MSQSVAIGDTVLHRGCCLDVLPTIADASVDAVICDPPYPEISRPYGRMTELEWHAMMDVVVPECRRVLKPTGSAVFVLQPNSERVGRMRTWLWEFMAKWGKEWGMVQDAWWWNTATMPGDYGGLLRPSVKACAWFGPHACYRNQDTVLWSEAPMSRVAAVCARARNAGREESPSGRSVDRSKSGDAAVRRGGVTPFNVIPTTHGQGKSVHVAASFGHGAGTPRQLCEWWVKYITPDGGTVLDPFVGSGTVALAALKLGRKAIGIERDPGYFATATKRVTEAAAKEAESLFAGVA